MAEAGRTGRALPAVAALLMASPRPPSLRGDLGRAQGIAVGGIGPLRQRCLRRLRTGDELHECGVNGDDRDAPGRQPGRRRSSRTPCWGGVAPGRRRGTRSRPSCCRRALDAFALHDLDARLAELTFDSLVDALPVRGVTDAPRMLTFRAGE